MPEMVERQRQYLEKKYGVPVEVIAKISPPDSFYDKFVIREV